jgi:hypothetical protein
MKRRSLDRFDAAFNLYASDGYAHRITNSRRAAN